MRIITIWILFLCVGYTLLTQSCKKFVSISPSPDLIHTTELFNSESSAKSAILGLYTQLRATNPSFANGTLSIYCGLSSDELNTISTVLDYNAFQTNSIVSTSSVINTQLWSSAYRVIYKTTALLEGLDNSSGIPVNVIKQFEGELKTIRAFTYLNLVTLFGDVPLVLTSNYKTNEQMPRTSSDLVYKQMTKDLSDAISLLSEDYNSNLRTRINKHAASALLARLYLYQKDWVNAEKISTSIIESGAYDLLTNPDGVFKNNSNETIWQIAPNNEARNTVEGGVFIPASISAVPTTYLSSYLLDSFEEGDLRKQKWTAQNTINNKPYIYPFKYKRRAVSPVDEYTIVLRLAEQILIRAEARLNLNDPDGCLFDINLIRTRAGLTPLLTVEKKELSEALMKERQIEFFAEFGHRWLDLKRTGQIDQILSTVKGSYWQKTDSLFPIPFNELQINSALVQNLGY